MPKEDITLLVDGKNAFPKIIECIENAKSSIEINMFIWRDDEIGNRMAEAVLSAADRGVKVNISVDRYGVVLEKCEERKKSFFHKKLSFVEAVKIFILKLLYPKNVARGRARDERTPTYIRVVSHPNIKISANEFKADHSKWYIIDESILFVGGINIEDKENGCDINGTPYGDYMVMLCGEKYVKAFKTKRESGQNCIDGLFFGVNLKKHAEIFEMEELYIDLFKSAKSRLHITMAYFSPLKKFLDEIVAAHKRGVRVTIVVPQKANFQNSSNRLTVRRLLKATDGQIEVYFSPRMLHTKLVLNDEYASLGSTNITKKAFGQLDELNLFVKRGGTEFDSALEKSIGHDIGEARRILNYKDVKYNRLLAFFEGFLV